jgi:hypothetical protein
MVSFRQFVALREGLLLPDKPPRPGLPRINTTPFQNRRRTRTLRPRRVKIARTPTVKNVRVARIPPVPTA